MPMFVMIDGGRPKLAPQSQQGFNTGVSSSATFTNMAFGPEAADRYLLACLTRQTNSTLTGCTIGGQAATILGTVASSMPVAFAVLKAPTGSIGDVFAQWSSTTTRWACALMSLTGWQAQHFDLAAVANANVPAMAAIAAMAGGAASFVSSNPGISYTGLTPDTFIVIQNNVASAEAAYANLDDAETPHAMSVSISNAGAASGSGRAIFWN